MASAYDTNAVRMEAGKLYRTDSGKVGVSVEDDIPGGTRNNQGFFQMNVLTDQACQGELPEEWEPLPPLGEWSSISRTL